MINSMTQKIRTEILPCFHAKLTEATVTATIIKPEIEMWWEMMKDVRTSVTLAGVLLPWLNHQERFARLNTTLLIPRHLHHRRLVSR